MRDGGTVSPEPSTKHQSPKEASHLFLTGLGDYHVILDADWQRSTQRAIQQRSSLPESSPEFQQGQQGLATQALPAHNLFAVFKSGLRLCVRLLILNVLHLRLLALLVLQELEDNALEAVKVLCRGTRRVGHDRAGRTRARLRAGGRNRGWSRPDIRANIGLRPVGACVGACVGHRAKGSGGGSDLVLQLAIRRSGKGSAGGGRRLCLQARTSWHRGGLGEVGWGRRRIGMILDQVGLHIEFVCDEKEREEVCARRLMARKDGVATGCAIYMRGAGQTRQRGLRW